MLCCAVQGDQSREVVRVLVECCLQEARYNPYYGHLAARLAAVSKGYKVGLRKCHSRQVVSLAVRPGPLLTSVMDCSAAASPCWCLNVLFAVCRVAVQH